MYHCQALGGPGREGLRVLEETLGNKRQCTKEVTCHSTRPCRAKRVGGKAKKPAFKGDGTTRKKGGRGELEKRLNQTKIHSPRLLGSK